MLLDVLLEQHEQHTDRLFNSNRLTFSEALAKLYQRLNPQIDMGQRTPQTIGEELLDYRNYLEMEVEVNRGSDGWLRESGALSTEGSYRYRDVDSGDGGAELEDESVACGKDISPCRLLFLDGGVLTPAIATPVRAVRTSGDAADYRSAGEHQSGKRHYL